jgi:hypothetical protein
MVAPLLIAAGITAAIGVGAQAFGTVQASSAAKAEAAAQRQGQRKANKLLKKQAAIQTKAAKRAAEIIHHSAKDQKQIREDLVADVNALRQQQVAAQNQQVDASIKAETARFQQMKLISAREQRDVIRNAIIARSIALSGATASGAEGGSGLQGGFAQIAAQRNDLLLGIFQNTGIGSAIFEANKAFAIAGGLANEIGASILSRQSLGEADIAENLAQREVSIARSSADFNDQLSRVGTKLNKVQAQTAAKVGSARTDLVTAQGIQSLGSSLTSAGVGLFGAG